jgi:hypothetical protein
MHYVPPKHSYLHCRGEVSMFDTSPTLIILQVVLCTTLFLPQVLHWYWHINDHCTELIVFLQLPLCSTPLFKVKSKSKPCYDWRSVSQYVLVSNSLWNLCPDIIFCLKVAVLSLWGALSDERSGLSLIGHCHQCLVHCQWFKSNLHFTCYMF